MADSNSDDSKEDQDANASVDNVCYAEIRSGKDASVEEDIMIDKGSVDCKEQNMGIPVDNICYEKLQSKSYLSHQKPIDCFKTMFVMGVPLTKSSMYAHTGSPPTIVDYQQEVQCLEGEQVSLMVKFAGIPTPTITWFFNGRKVEDDYSTELGKDGSLVLVSVEIKQAGTYNFTVSNRVGSVKGCTKLVVHTEDEYHASAPRVESNPVTREKFGEYVSTFHAHNNSAFIGQFQV